MKKEYINVAILVLELILTLVSIYFGDVSIVVNIFTIFNLDSLVIPLFEIVFNILILLY